MYTHLLKLISVCYQIYRKTVTKYTVDLTYSFVEVFCTEGGIFFISYRVLKT